MKKSTVLLLWGGITAIACEAHRAILVWQGISLSGWSYFNFLIFFLGLFVGIRQFRDKVNGGYLKFGKGYVFSLLMTSIVAIIGFISVIITLKLVPDLGDRLINEMHIKFINSGLSQDMIDKMMPFYERAFTPNMIKVNSIIGNVFVGAILGLIATGINTKKKPFMQEDDELQGGEGMQS